MSQRNKVVRSDGMVPRPQPFQRQDRYFETLIAYGADARGPHFRGFAELKPETDPLRTGTSASAHCHGVLPNDAGLLGGP